MTWTRLKDLAGTPLSELTQPTRSDWIFALRTVSAGLIALLAAYALKLDHPQWAMMTVFIVAQPVAGMVLAKGFYRLLGTLAGGLAAIGITSLFGTNPWLLVTVLATMDRRQHPRFLAAAQSGSLWRRPCRLYSDDHQPAGIRAGASRRRSRCRALRRNCARHRLRRRHQPADPAKARGGRHHLQAETQHSRSRRLRLRRLFRRRSGRSCRSPAQADHRCPDTCRNAHLCAPRSAELRDPRPSGPAHDRTAPVGALGGPRAAYPCRAGECDAHPCSQRVEGNRRGTRYDARRVGRHRPMGGPARGNRDQGKRNGAGGHRSR